MHKNETIYSIPAKIISTSHPTQRAATASDTAQGTPALLIRHASGIVVAVPGSVCRTPVERPLKSVRV